MSGAADRFLGGLMMAVGGLLAGLCGSCTALTLGAGVLGFAGQALAVALAPKHWIATLAGAGGFTLLVAVVGGAPTVAGIVIFRAGRRVYDRGSRDA